MSPRTAAAGTAAAVALFLVAWGAVHADAFTRDEIVDTPVYEEYGDAVARGRVPYRDFRPEYPPLALPVFAVPSLLVGADARQREYRDAFEWLMAAAGTAMVCAVAVALIGLRSTGRRFALVLAFVALTPLLAGSVVLTRFDLFPAALTAAVLAAFVHGRDRAGAAVLGAAIAAKLYPAVMLPPALVWIARRRGRREAIVCGAIAAGLVAGTVLPFLVVAPDGVAASAGRQLSRPLQVESLGGAALLAAHRALGLPVEVASSHGSQNLRGDAAVAAAAALSLVQIGALVALWAAFARIRPRINEFVAASAAAVVCFVALGKVFSPQFLIWLVPLVPLVAGRVGAAATALLAAALLATQGWFPSRYWPFALGDDAAVPWLVLARDVLVLVLLAALVAAVMPRLGRTRRGTS